eukprot:TRINITY_DN1271_c0_g1_i2.p1 TRINITY_DN1271_c0_g1~~TRINITY_DN1271_c0_g1_i2.p1  ORF type:complete len:181 (-),score=38.30 TRINITY_DN1271_c0_g1_i2:31-573(-)
MSQQISSNMNSGMFSTLLYLIYLAFDPDESWAADVDDIVQKDENDDIETTQYQYSTDRVETTHYSNRNRKTYNNNYKPRQNYNDDRYHRSNNGNRSNRPQSGDRNIRDRPYSGGKSYNNFDQPTDNQFRSRSQYKKKQYNDFEKRNFSSSMTIEEFAARKSVATKNKRETDDDLFGRKTK